MTDQTQDQNPDEQVIGGAVVAPDGSVVQLTPEQAEELAQAIEDQKAERKRLIGELIDELNGKRDESIRAKREIEKRWIEDIRQYDGDDRLLNTKEFPSQNGEENMRPPVPHLIRARTDLWESRLCDMLVPTNDSTWDLVPTPEEDTAPPDGQTVDQWQQAMPQTRDDQTARCEKMKAVIQDQMAACNAPRVLRRCIRDACRLGTGLVMGPLNAVHVKRTFAGGQAQMRITERTIPEVREGDPWFFFPEMTQTAEKASFAHYLHIMSSVDLYKLAETPGFDREEIAKVIASEPEFGEIAVNIRNRANLAGESEPMEGRYPVWRYTGIIDRKFINKALGLMPKTDDKDLPPMIVGDIWYSGSSILKAKISPLFAAKDFRIPYFVYSPFPADDTMFGYSIPYLGRDSQRSAKAAWTMGLHNASVSSGPLVIARQGALRSKDGKPGIRGPKWFDVMPDFSQIDLNNLVTVINIPNNAGQAFEIFERAQALMDEELNTLQWASPESSEQVNTNLQFSSLMNNRTILQRRASAIADDELFCPMVERFVLWNNLYNQRTDIQGDFDVIPLCQSVRLVKDIQAQQTMWFAQFSMSSPAFQGMYDPYELYTAVSKNVDIPRDRLITPKDQWQKYQQQMSQQSQIDPVKQAQVAYYNARTSEVQMRQQTMQQKQAIDANADAQAQTFEAQNRQLDHAEFNTEKQLQFAQLESHERQTNSQIQSDNFQAALAHDAARGKNAATLDQSARRERTEMVKTGAQARTEMHKLAMPKKPATDKPQAQPKVTFKTPKLPNYRGGKR